MTLLDADGLLAWGAALNPEDSGEFLPADEFAGLYGELCVPPVGRPDDRAHSALVLLDVEAVLIAFAPILTSHNLGPAQGTLVIAQRLNEDLIANLANSLKLNLTLIRVDQLQNDPDLAAIVEDLTGGKPHVLHAVDSDNLAAYGVLEDISGDPAFLVRIDKPRDIYRQAIRTTNLIALLLAVVTTLAFVAALLLLQHLVLHKLEQLSARINRIARTQDFGTQLPDAGNDELDSMAGDVNCLLSAVVESRRTLAQSEQRYELAIIGAGAGLWDWDMVSGTVFYSEQWKRMLGYADAEVEDTFAGWKNLWHPDDAAIIQQTIDNYLAGTIPAYRIEHRLRHKDGSWRWILACGNVQRDEAGNALRWTGTNLDVTERKHSEQLLLQANRRLAAATAQANAMAQRAERDRNAKGEFLANMSHEIRTPLNGVIGMTELILDSGLSPLQRKQAEVVLGSAESLLCIVNDILDFSKIEAGKLALESIAFDLRHLLDEFTQAMRLRADKKGLRLDLSVDQSVPKGVVGDPGRLRQILSNIVGNAIKFTAQGEVAIRVVARPPAPDNLNNGDVTRNVLLGFSISDTGIGIPDDKRSELFNRFSQADTSTTRQFGGTGLGLAIVRQLCELMGGDIEVESTHGVGSVFHFTLPFGTCEPLRESDLGGSSRSPQPFKPLSARILLAEDNEVNQRVAVGILAKLGLQPQIAANGAEAVRAFVSQPFDLILMDVQMPLMDGFEATRKIRSIEAENQLPPAQAIPIIAMTAHAMQGDRDNCIAAGMNDYLSKPIQSKQLSIVLRKWLQPDTD